jgi:hypothetical protein
MSKLQIEKHNKTEHDVLLLGKRKDQRKFLQLTPKKLYNFLFYNLLHAYNSL